MVRRGFVITVLVLVACYPPNVPGVVEEPDSCHFGLALREDLLTEIRQHDRAFAWLEILERRLARGGMRS